MGKTRILLIWINYNFIIKKYQSALIILVSGISFTTISALDGALREVGVYNAWLDM